MRQRIIAALCGLLASAGCANQSVSYDTQFVLKPWMQQYNQSALASLPDVRLYAFAADTTAWYVASYDDAAAGILTSRADASHRIAEPYAAGEPFGEVDTIPTAVDWRKMRLRLASATVVAVDTRNKLYAYTQQQLYENLSPLYVSVTFQPWRRFVRYAYGGWTYVNEFFDPDAPATADYLLNPTVQWADHGEIAPHAGVKAYVYAVDTTDWRIASYEDALAGVLTSKEDPAEQLATPDYTAEADGDRLRMTVTDDLLMAVAVDPETRIYGYAKQTLLPGGAPVEATVTFCPWRTEYLYANGSWRMVDESQRGDNPEPYSDPDTPDPAEAGRPQRTRR